MIFGKYYILNYRDIQDKKALAAAFMETNLRCHYKDDEDFIKKMNLSKPKKLPQYFFMFEENKLIGEFFIGKRGLCKKNWYSIDNSDELPKELALFLLEAEKEVFMEFGIDDGVESVEYRKEMMNKDV